MGAFTSVTSLGCTIGGPGRMKAVVCTAVCPASYDTGGSVIDLSTAGGLGADGFQKIHGVSVLNVDPVASHKYLPTYLKASAAAPATGKISLGLVYQATPAEESAATDTSATTLTLLVVGY